MFQHETADPRPVAIAVPGDLDTVTGGYIYDRRVIAALRDAGRAVRHVQLPAGFPAPTAAEMHAAALRLSDVPRDHVLMIDGLAFGALDGDLVSRLARPLVALVHHPLALETGLPPDRQAALRMREAANLAHAAAVVVTSRHTAQVLVQEYGVPGDRITIARPGVVHPDQPAEPADPPLILSVGTLIHRKGHDVLLDALALIADLDWRAVIAGKALDGSVGAALRERTAGHGLASRVRFLGEIAPDELQAQYSAACLFALATRYEGYGMVFAEALASGVPVVSCRAGAVPGTVPASAGILVPPDDAGAFAAALRRVLTDADLHDTLAAGAWAAGRTLPGWTDTAALIGRVIDRV